MGVAGGGRGGGSASSSATTHCPLSSCFRPGDSIRAEVVSVSDPRSVVLSTLGRGLGVVRGVSESGFGLRPRGGREDAMECEGTGVWEERWVAVGEGEEGEGEGEGEE